MIVKKIMREDVLEIITKDTKLLFTFDGGIVLETEFDRFSLIREEDNFFRDWASYKYYIKTRRIVPSTILDDVIRTLRGLVWHYKTEDEVSTEIGESKIFVPRICIETFVPGPEDYYSVCNEHKSYNHDCLECKDRYLQSRKLNSQYMIP